MTYQETDWEEHAITEYAQLKGITIEEAESEADKKGIQYLEEALNCEIETRLL